MRTTIIYDFDKTLTWKDSLSVFFYHDLNCISVFCYLILKILSKIHLISVKKEKELTFRWLCSGKADEIRKRLRDFAYKIEFNPIMRVCEQQVATGARVVIVSAAPEDYLKIIFPDIEVFGSVLIDDGKNIVGLYQHPIGKEKCAVLLKNGITSIDTMYYDSDSDEELIPMCKHWNRIENGKIIFKGNNNVK